MKYLTLFALSLGFLSVQPSATAADWENSIITLQATAKSYDYSRPWSRSSRNVNKVGIVIGKNQFLTTAEGLQNLTMLRLQKYGRGQWHSGQLDWIDYHANIAVISAKEAPFAEGLVPAKFGNVPASKEDWTIMRWKRGNLEKRAAEFNQFLVQDGRLTFIQHLQMEASSEMDAVGWSEPLIAGDRIIALASGQIENNVRFIPVSFFQKLLNKRLAGKPAELGYFPFVWTQVENPELFSYLKLDGEPRGALVIKVPEVPATTGQLKEKDIILEVEGRPIDNEGYYRDPDYGLLIMENLSTRGKLAGDNLSLKVWRDGKAIDLDYKLPAADFGYKLIPDSKHDQAPEYLIVGGLMFQPLDGPYLSSIGGASRAPARVTHFAEAHPTKDRKGLVVLSLVIPDPFNLGYQNLRWLVVDKFNGRKISSIADIRAAMKKPIDGFHEIGFMKGWSTEHVVLDAAKEPEATQRIMNHYRIPAPKLFSAN